MKLKYDFGTFKVTTTCPKCESTCEFDALDFLFFLNILEDGLECDDCGSVFMVETVLLDPRRLTLDEAVRELADSPATDVRTEDK